MESRTKKVLITCGVIVLLLLIMNYFKKDPGIKQIMAKLDSTKVMLDSAQERINSSHILITNLQANVDSYSQQVKEADYNVSALEASRNRRENDFLKKISASQQSYEAFKIQLNQHKRTFWPVIVIDTSHYQLSNAN